MYQALYRKWRPKTFSDVAGQEHITKTLQNELKFKRVSHAYLFVGTRGTGKTTCAKILAKAVNCLNPHEGDACSECEICKGIDNGSIMDVIELDAASNNGVNDIRSICESAAFSPSRCKYRVYIIDEVHMLSAGAFAAMLKTLEEPPPHVIFILATTELHKLPATILSRCQRFEFLKIDLKTISKRLTYIASCENTSISEDAALLLSHCSLGSLRDAVSLLDKCMGLQTEITKKFVQEITGLTPATYLFDIIFFLKQGNIPQILTILDNLYNSSKDIPRLCEELMFCFRDIMLEKLASKGKKLVFLTKEEHEKIHEISQMFSLSEIISILDIIKSCFDKIPNQTNPKIELEFALIKIVQTLSGEEPPVAAKPQLLQVNKNPKIKMAPEPTAEKANLNEPLTPQKEKAIKTEEKEIKEMKQWPEILKRLAFYSKTASTAFKGSTACIDGNMVLIDAPQNMACDIINRQEQKEKLISAIKDITGNNYRVNIRKKQQNEENVIRNFIESAKMAGIPVSEIN